MFERPLSIELMLEFDVLMVFLYRVDFELDVAMALFYRVDLEFDVVMTSLYRIDVGVRCCNGSFL